MIIIILVFDAETTPNTVRPKFHKYSFWLNSSGTSIHFTVNSYFWLQMTDSMLANIHH